MNIKTSSSGNGRPPESPGLGKPDCPICEGLGYTIPDVPPAHPNFGRAVPCTCRAAEREMAHMNSLLELSQIGPLKELTFDSFLVEGFGLNDRQKLNLKLAYNKLLAFAKEPSGWLVLQGGYGCGKTHLAAAVANHRLALGHFALFVSTPDLLDYLRAAYAPSAAQSYDQRFDQVRNAPLVILDDMGAENETAWAAEKLYQVLNHRYIHQLPTIITTNKQLTREFFDSRILSRMVDYQLVETIQLRIPDFRRSQGVHAFHNHSELSSLDLHIEKTFDSFDLRQGELPRGQAENLKRAVETARDFAENPQDWLVFNSAAFGNGKTHLAAAIANEVARKDEAVLFVVVPDLLDHLRATFNPSSGARLDKRFDEVKMAPLLVLDDLGTESATAWAREKLYQLFNYRYNARLPTVITTASQIDELDPKLATRMLDVSRCTFFLIEAPSYRGRVKPKQKPRKR